jgi:hypothetical protein
MAGDGPINKYSYICLMDHDLIGSEPLNKKGFFEFAKRV